MISSPYRIHRTYDRQTQARHHKINALTRYRRTRRMPGGISLHARRSSCTAHQAQSSRKEVFQPHLPVRLPCYDLAPITSFTLGRPSRLRTSGTPGFHGLTGGVYKARERIHRAMADARLLANPASRSRVADSGPNWERIWGFASPRGVAAFCTSHCNTCVAPDVRAVLI